MVKKKKKFEKDSNRNLRYLKNQHKDVTLYGFNPVKPVEEENLFVSCLICWMTLVSLASCYIPLISFNSPPEVSKISREIQKHAT